MRLGSHIRFVFAIMEGINTGNKLWVFRCFDFDKGSLSGLSVHKMI